MSIDLVMLLIAALCAAGGVASWWYGEQQYGKGILDGIQMHNSGRLKYTTYEEDGQTMINIKIDELEDEE